jgi:hypothetical protein
MLMTPDVEGATSGRTIIGTTSKLNQQIRIPDLGAMTRYKKCTGLNGGCVSNFPRWADEGTVVDVIHGGEILIS